MKKPLMEPFKKGLEGNQTQIKPSWQKNMYGNLSASLLLDSLERHKEAENQTKFLIQTLGLSKSSLLDIPCGAGRFALSFGKRGFFVIGVDINDICLEIARKHIAGRKNIKIKKGNMKHLKWAKGKFDIVLNMYTSFGYFPTDRENERILKGFAKALRPGGKLIIQTINTDWLLSNFSPKSASCGMGRPLRKAKNPLWKNGAIDGT